MGAKCRNQKQDRFCGYPPFPQKARQGWVTHRGEGHRL